MRKFAAVLAALLSASAAQAETGRTGAATLIRTFSAAPAALGGAQAAADGRLDAVAFNPAAAGRLPSPEIQATYLKGLADDSLGGVRYGQSLPFGAIFVGLDYFDAGAIDVNLSNGFQGSRRAQQDSVGTVGFALGRHSPLSIGAAVKAFRLELAEEASASGVAFDAGAIWVTPLEGLSLGVSGTNAGADIEFEEQADPLPFAGRAGLSYTLALSRFRALRDIPYAVQLLVDGIAEREEDAAVRAGLEVRREADIVDTSAVVALRAGYQGEPEAFTTGLGVRIAGFGIDYAFSIIDEIDNTHRATLSWRFLSRAEKVAVGLPPTPSTPSPVRRRLPEPQ